MVIKSKIYVYVPADLPTQEEGNVCDFCNGVSE